ncbi:MAG: hypothetical protein RBT63_05120 [Bdellovibrionales bacterium]|jgi:hypothetical protein|nr:hypothetical protein [Bdellovibrionales bacterium]
MNGFNRTRAFMVIHVVLVLLLPFLFTQMGGCMGEKELVPMKLGPEASADDIDNALFAPLAHLDPTTIQPGEAFVFSETQELGLGIGHTVLSDTSQTVVDRQEDASYILLTVVEHFQKYEKGEVLKKSTEIPVLIEKAQPASDSTLRYAGKTEPQTEGERKITSLPPFVEKIFRGQLRSQSVGNDHKPLLFKAASDTENLSAQDNAQDSAEVRAFEQDITRISYHGLTVNVTNEPPPELVQRQPNCMDIPNCRIEVHHVNFDMVLWRGEKPERIHWSFALSPDAPFLASTMNKCVTSLASLGGNQGEILVKQCLPVINFRYSGR